MRFASRVEPGTSPELSSLGETAFLPEDCGRRKWESRGDGITWDPKELGQRLGMTIPVRERTAFTGKYQVNIRKSWWTG